MNFDKAFKILEIEPTDDKKKIKIAYSKILKEYHPEEFPEMFMKIREAYQTALEFEEYNFDEVKYNKTNFKNDDYEEVFFENDIQNTDIEDEVFSDIFNGKYE